MLGKASRDLTQNSMDSNQGASLPPSALRGTLYLCGSL